MQIKKAFYPLVLLVWLGACKTTETEAPPPAVFD